MTTKKCNICGKTFDTFDDMFDFGLHTIIGYGSKRDGDTINLDVCTDCVDELLDELDKRCVITPFIEQE